MPEEKIYQIEELPDLKVGWDRAYEYQNVPLLDYVWVVADYFLPFYEETDEGMVPAESIAPAIFCNRYFESGLTIEERYERAKEMGMCNATFEQYSQAKNRYRPLDVRFKNEYLKSEEVLDALNSYCIDIGKFWYLSLFIKDVVLDKCVDAMPAETSNDRIQKLTDRISEMPDGKNAELIFKLKGKQKYVIADEYTIKEIGVALAVYKKLIENCGVNGGQLDVNKMLNGKVTVDRTPMFALFTKMMKYFLSPYKAVRSSLTSTDKMLLISRMIYVLGLSDDRRFYEEYETDEDGKIIIDGENNYKKRNFLKNLIRKYEDYKYATIGVVYG